MEILGDRPRILVVEDEPLIRRGLARELSRDFEVFFAGDAAAALPVLDGPMTILAVVADYMLGSGPTGVDLLQIVKERYPACARILLSSLMFEAEYEALLDAGVVERFVRKPWEDGDLVDIIRRLIRAHELPPIATTLRARSNP